MTKSATLLLPAVEVVFFGFGLGRGFAFSFVLPEALVSTSGDGFAFTVRDSEELSLTRARLAGGWAAESSAFSRDPDGTSLRELLVLL